MRYDVHTFIMHLSSIVKMSKRKSHSFVKTELNEMKNAHDQIHVRR